MGRMAEDTTVLYAVKQVELAVRSHLDALLRPAGLTALQYTALTVLRRREGLSAAELARNSFVTPQSMADMVVALESRGFISRRRDPANRRRLLLGLTEEGADVLREYDGRVQGLETLMLEPLEPDERRALLSYLKLARGALDANPPH
jgi:DNA-binding MarR family transcriptional regulator